MRPVLDADRPAARDRNGGSLRGHLQPELPLAGHGCASYPELRSATGVRIVFANLDLFGPNSRSLVWCPGYGELPFPLPLGASKYNPDCLILLSEMSFAEPIGSLLAARRKPRHGTVGRPG